MKQTNKLPRQVGYSLLKSLYLASTSLLAANSLSDSRYNNKHKKAMISRNSTLFLERDIDAMKSITTFYQQTMEKLQEGNPLPTGSFITVAKHHIPNLKYVSTDTSVGIVLTTAMLKRILELSTTVGYDVKGHTIADRGILYSCEALQYTSDMQHPSVAFLKILDTIRYFEEIDSVIMEISLDGIHNDYESSLGASRGYYHNTKAQNSQKAKSVFPMISDRYQHDSWLHYLSTLYSGIVEPDTICAINTELPMTVMLAELKGVSA